MARLLIADDEPSMRTLMGDTAGALGHDVLTAENGREAARILDEEAGAVDLLVTDMRMPDGMGGDLVRGVLENPDLRDLAIIVVSAYAPAEEVAGFTSRGRSIRFLTKPFSLDAFRETVRAALGEEV